MLRDIPRTEWPDVTPLLVRANREHLSSFPSEVAAGYEAELRDVSTWPAAASVTVASSEAEPSGIAGCVMFVPDAADDGHHPWPAGGAVLRFLAVDAPCRGLGIGRRLVEHCIAAARRDGASFLALHTAPAMSAARVLYEQLGFDRAASHDFDPRAHYAEGTGGDAAAWGLAYLLRLE